MAWRVARSLDQLRKQVQIAYPNRSRISDGTIGDAAHCPGPSDHCPNSADVVCALDLTHDPAAGADMDLLSESIKNDPRVKYLIWDRRIWNARISRSWRPYSGSNPHTKHMHISVHGAYDDTSPWDLPGNSKEDDVTQDDIEAIAQAVWAKELNGKRADSRITDADVRTAQNQDILSTLVGYLRDRFGHRNIAQDLRGLRRGVRAALHHIGVDKDRLIPDDDDFINS